jgi:hypothetical protein
MEITLAYSVLLHAYIWASFCRRYNVRISNRWNVHNSCIGYADDGFAIVFVALMVSPPLQMFIYLRVLIRVQTEIAMCFRIKRWRLAGGRAVMALKPGA